MKRLIRMPGHVWRSLKSAVNRRGDLSQVVSQADPEASLSDRVRWMEGLMEWIGSTSRLPHDFDESTGQLHWVRLRFLLQFLSRNPEWRKNVGRTIRSILDEVSGVELFSRTGLIQDRGLASEVLDRALKKVLPAAPQERNLDDLFPRFFRSDNDALWVENLPEDVYAGLINLLGFDNPKRGEGAIVHSMLDALTVLAEEIAARGVSPEMRHRLPFPSVTQSPFLKFRREIEEVIEDLREGRKPKPNRSEAGLESCMGAIERIYQQLDKEGVSVGLVYNLESQKAALVRTATLLDLVQLEDPVSEHRTVTLFLGDLIRESHAARRIRPLLHSNLRLLSQKIVERAGASGEHYIVRTREEYRQMLRAGLGGGLITVFTTLFKYAITGSKLPLFFEGLFASLNYGWCFCIMQLAGFTLATKQPAMTGPALAGKLRHLKDPKDIRAFVEEVTLLTRSQFAAAFGNVWAALPGAFALDLLWFWMKGHHILHTEKALYSMKSFNPFTTLTIAFAIWTGVILWSSGIVAGWVENWVVYRKLPDAIAHHRFLRIAFGERRTNKAADWFLHNIGGLSGSMWLGFLLGFSPIVGEFFGFPLEVRHVTLAAASVGFSAAGLIGPKFPWVTFLMGMLGLAVMLALNLGVSLGLAFTLACRAREVRSRAIFLLLRATVAELRRRPFSFLFVRRKRESAVN